MRAGLTMKLGGTRREQQKQERLIHKIFVVEGKRQEMKREESKGRKESELDFMG